MHSLTVDLTVAVSYQKFLRSRNVQWYVNGACMLDQMSIDSDHVYFGSREKRLHRVHVLACAFLCSLALNSLISLILSARVGLSVFEHFTGWWFQ